MLPIRPTQLDAALLYEDFKPFAYADLVRGLQLVFGEHAKVNLGAHEDGSFGVIIAAGFIIKVSQNHEPLEMAGFRPTLNSPFTKVSKPNAQEIVAKHRKNIFVTLGDDAILMPDFAPGTFGKEMDQIISDARTPAKVPDTNEFSKRVFIARLVISQIMNIAKPDLIHWCQSDQLFTAEEMAPLSDPRNMALQIHPSIYSPGNDEHGKQKIGFHAFGSEHIIGQHVIVDATARPFGAVLPAVHDLIYALSKNSDEIESGKVLALKSKAAFRVHKKPADDVHPRPYLRIEVLETGDPAQRADLKAKAEKLAATTAIKKRGFIVSLFRSIVMFGLKAFGRTAVIIILLLVLGNAISQTVASNLASVIK